jgi:hypothetical protein
MYYRGLYRRGQRDREMPVQNGRKRAVHFERAEVWPDHHDVR